MDSVSIIGWQFGCVFYWVNMLWGPFWVYFGSILGPLGVRLGHYLSVHLFMLVLLGKKCIFAFFLKYPKGKKNQSLAPTLTLNSNNKFLKKNS